MAIDPEQSQKGGRVVYLLKSLRRALKEHVRHHKTAVPSELDQTRRAGRLSRSPVALGSKSDNNIASRLFTLDESTMGKSLTDLAGSGRHAAEPGSASKLFLVVRTSSLRQSSTRGQSFSSESNQCCRAVDAQQLVTSTTTAVTAPETPGTPNMTADPFIISWRSLEEPAWVCGDDTFRFHSVVRGDCSIGR